MLQVGFIRVIRDCLGTAEGECLKCGTYFSVTIPSDQSALRELYEVFNEHVTKAHPDVVDGGWQAKTLIKKLWPRIQLKKMADQ